MRHTNTRFGLVDVLPARSARTEGIYFKVFFVDIHFYVFGFGKHRHRNGGSMNTPLRLGVGYSLHPMNAAFVFKFTVNALAAYRKHDFFDSAEFGVVFVDKFGFPTIFFGEFKVHSVQFVGK